MIFRFLGAQWFAIVFVALVSFALSIVIARAIGPAQFGIYSIALSAGGLLAIFIDGGFSKLLQRERTRSTESLTEILSRLPSLALGHATLIILISSLIVLLTLPAHGLTMMAAVWLFGMAVLNQFGLAILRGDGRLVRDASWQVGNRALTAICVVGAIFLLGVRQPWQIFFAQFIGAAIFGFLVLRYLRVSLIWRIPPMIYRVVLPFVWLDLATALYFRTDMLLLGLLDVPTADIGHYGVAHRFIELVVLFASPIGLILFRRFRLAEIVPTKLVRKLLPILLMSVIVGLLIFLAFRMLGDYIIVMAYGADFHDAALLLGILGCSLFFMLPNGVLNQAALALNLEKWLAVSATSAAAVNIAGNLMAIPVYGVIAAAWMAVLTEVVMLLCVAGGIAVRCYQSMRGKN